MPTSPAERLGLIRDLANQREEDPRDRVLIPRELRDLVFRGEEPVQDPRSRVLSVQELRDRVFRFLHGFKTGGLRLQSGEQELWDADRATDAELKAVARKVQKLLTTAFLFDGPPRPGTGGMAPDGVQLLTFPSMRYAAFAPKGGRGRFTLMVTGGRLRDLVPFLTMWLLTTEDVTISRCAAPAHRNWKEECGRFFIGTRIGRPQLYCDDECANRVKSKAKFRGGPTRREKEARAALKRDAQRRKSTQQQGRKKR